eukprot:COSAG06_NODE_755_length_12532_cov_10.124990_8_plen_217_part_00
MVQRRAPPPGYRIYERVRQRLQERRGFVASALSTVSRRNSPPRHRLLAPALGLLPLCLRERCCSPLPPRAGVGCRCVDVLWPTVEFPVAQVRSTGDVAGAANGASPSLLTGRLPPAVISHTVHVRECRRIRKPTILPRARGSGTNARPPRNYMYIPPAGTSNSSTPGREEETTSRGDPARAATCVNRKPGSARQRKARRGRDPSRAGWYGSRADVV